MVTLLKACGWKDYSEISILLLLGAIKGRSDGPSSGPFGGYMSRLSCLIIEGDFQCVTFLASGNSLALWRLADMVEEMHGFAKKLQVTFCHILRRASMKHTFSQKMGQGICP